MRRILAIGPKDSADRITPVAHALAARRPGLAPMTPVEILAGQESWPEAYQRALGITEKTVQTHLGNTFQRTGVSDRTQAALWAERNGLLSGS